METITYQPIGIIHSPFKDLAQMPIQPCSEASAEGDVEVFPEYVVGLKDLSGFSHIILLYHFHKAGERRLTVVPFMDSEPHGIFATRAPVRPNPIGLSVVRLIHVEANILHVSDLDILDGTPLLDIKPYIPEFDYRQEARLGWFERNIVEARRAKSDQRFC